MQVFGLSLKSAHSIDLFFQGKNIFVTLFLVFMSIKAFIII